VLAIDSEHSSRVSALERSLRSRNRLLEVRNYDDHWCDAIERETAELAVAVAASRGQTLTKLAAMLRARGAASAFPSAAIALDGWMENALVSEPATAVEDRYRAILRDSRARDAAAGRTLDGPHLTDLQVIYAPKGMPARDASTGEQKALLIGLVLAHASLVAEMTGSCRCCCSTRWWRISIPNRRDALFDELAKLGAQVWMTGADPAAFTEIGASGEILTWSPGRSRAAPDALRLVRGRRPTQQPVDDRIDQKRRAIGGEMNLVAGRDIGPRCRRSVSGSLQRCKVYPAPK